MSARLNLTVADVATRITNGYTALHVYRSLTEAGTYTLIHAVTLVSGTTSYSLIDWEGTGSHYYKTASWGSVPGEDSLSSAFQGTDSRPYTTITNVKNQIEKSGSELDTVIAGFIDVASRAVDSYCNRSNFLADTTATAKIFTGRGEPYITIPDCVEISSVAVKASRTEDTYTAWTSSDWIAASGQPDDPNWNDTPYNLLIIDPNGDYVQFTEGRYAVPRGVGVPTVQVTAKWGYSISPPAQIQQVVEMQVVRWQRRAKSAWADLTAMTQFGQMPYQPRNLDIDLQLMLTRWIKPEIG